MVFPTMWYVRPAKPQISLELLSLIGAAPARLSPHLSKCHVVGNHMSRLIVIIEMHFGPSLYQSKLTLQCHGVCVCTGDNLLA